MQHIFCTHLQKKSTGSHSKRCEFLQRANITDPGWSSGLRGAVVARVHHAAAKAKPDPLQRFCASVSLSRGRMCTVSPKPGVRGRQKAVCVIMRIDKSLHCTSNRRRAEKLQPAAKEAASGYCVSLASGDASWRRWWLTGEPFSQLAHSHTHTN